MNIEPLVIPDFFLLVDLRELFADLGSGGGTKKRAFFNISRTNSKASKVNQQSVLNL